MLRNATQTIAGAPDPFDAAPMLADGPGAHRPLEARPWLDKPPGPRGAVARAVPALMAISPSNAVERQRIAGRGIVAEVVHAAAGDGRVEYRCRADSHLLIAYEQGARRSGETTVEGMTRSSLRDFARKLTFVPAGHTFTEWQEPRTPARLIIVHLDPAALPADFRPVASRPLAPRLFFEDSALWSTLLKLKHLVEDPQSASGAYLEALGAVLLHELMRAGAGGGNVEAPARGGLAAWQRRLVAAYVEEHLAEPIPLATMAQIARLSPYHFSRAFKQSFGLPPHRYHTCRRIERAKTLLEKRGLSVTDIGLTLGFSETSSFTAAFRKTTGIAPSRYYRSVA